MLQIKTFLQIKFSRFLIVEISGAASVHRNPPRLLREKGRHYRTRARKLLNSIVKRSSLLIIQPINRQILNIIQLLPHIYMLVKLHPNG